MENILDSIREEEKMPLRKVAAMLDIDTSVLSKMERNERKPTPEMIPLLAKSLNKPEKEIEIEFIKSFLLIELGKLKYLKEGINDFLKNY